MGLGLVEIIVIALVAGIIIVVIALLVLRAKQGDGQDEPRQLGHTGSIAQQRAATTGAASTTKKLNWLVGEAGTAKGKTYHIGTRDVTIGRKVGNYIQLTDESISRTHLKVKGTTVGIIVEDMGSETGTFVNEERLAAGAPKELHNGDKVRMGDTILVFHKEGNFGTNHGLTEQKVAGTIQHKKTAAMGVVDWKAEVQNKLDEAGGDVAEAARKMGMPEDAFIKLMEKAGISPDA